LAELHSTWAEETDDGFVVDASDYYDTSARRKKAKQQNPSMRRFKDLAEAKRHAKRHAKRTDQPHYVYRLSGNPRYAVMPADHPVQRNYESGMLPLGNASLAHTAHPPAENPWEHVGGGCAVGGCAEGKRYPCDDDYEETETGETVSVDTTRKGHFELPTRYGGTLPSIAAIERQPGVKKGSVRRWKTKRKKNPAVGKVMRRLLREK
jgi:hypothetical protein